MVETISREELKTIPEYQALHETIKAHHKTPQYAIKALIEKKDVEGFCVQTRHFVMMKGSEALFIHYDASQWLKDDHLRTKIESVGVYDNWREYEMARLKGLHGGSPSEDPNRN